MNFAQKGTKKGFTLIELSFAIAFISVLLITITLITSEIVSIYRRGYSIKTINQVGRDIIEDIQNSITESPPASIVSFCSAHYSGDSQSGSRSNCDGDNSNKGFYSVYQQYYDEVHIRTSDGDADHDGYRDESDFVPTGGIFCSGKYTYIWNTGYLFNTDGAYKFSEPDTTKLRLNVEYDLSKNGTTQHISKNNFRLLKIEDSSRAICAATLTGDNGYPSSNQVLRSPGSINPATNPVIKIPFTVSNEPEEILSETDASLAFFDFVIFPPARVTSTNRLLFSGSFILATIAGGVDIMSTSNFCTAPSNFSADFSYCAINKFNFTIQASGS